jgi:DNA invertase Pin-like site-specific DNA recombinase
VCVAVGDRIGYARVSTADQDPQLQLDALSAADCLKTYTDTATGTTVRSGTRVWPTCAAATP